jgi:uncharacterized hydrophobic protein (TIGR00341 family)
MKKVVIYTTPGLLPSIQPFLANTLHFTTEREKTEGSEGTVGRMMITVYLPDPLLEDFISRMRSFANEVDRRLVVEVTSPDFVISSFLEDLKERLIAGKSKEKEKPPIERLVEATEAYTVLDLDKVSLAAIAGVVALIGLFLNNLGVIIGAMLISPLLGPIYALAINTAVGNVGQVGRCVKVLLALVGMIIVFAILTTAALSSFMVLPITPEIQSRMVASPVYIVMAILLGFATILALSKGIPEGVAGVAVAAALLPPAVVVGIAAVIAQGGLLKALILTLQNIFGLGLGSILAVTTLHIHPADSYGEWKAKKFLVRIAWILFVIFLFLLVISLLV